MKENPLVSIIIPVYNGANYLAEAINSALAQSYKNIEIIVINDGSTDDGQTKQIALSYGDTIRYFQKENGGCASALNYGINKAKGEFISWLSHDDLYNANKVETQINYYHTHSLDMQNTLVSNSGRLIDENGEPIYRPNSEKTALLDCVQMYRQLLFGEGYNGCGLLIPKYWFDQGLYFREDMRFVLDWNLWLKFAINGAKIYVNKEILVSNRMHSQQVTVKQADRHKPELTQSCQEIFELLQNHENPEFMRLLYYYCACTDQPVVRDIRNFMKKNGVSVQPLKKMKYVARRKCVKIAKRIYHAIRRIGHKR